MKVSDPIIFGHAVKAWLGPVWSQHGAAIAEAGGSPNSGLGDVLAAIETMPNGDEIKAEIDALDLPEIYMVDSDRASPTCMCRRT